MAFIGTVLAEDQLVLTRGRDFKWTFENTDENGEPTNFPAGELYFELDTGGETNAVQRVSVTSASGGTYKLGFKDVLSTPIDYYDATENPHGLDGDITDALESIPTIGTGNVRVTPVSMVPVWELNFTIDAPIDEVQRVYFTGNPTGGKFRLSYGLQYTDDIPFGSEASVVESALEALPAIGAGNVSVMKQPDGYLVTFINSMGGMDVEQLVGWHGWFGFGLTGGFFPNIQTATVVKGTAALSEQLVNMLNQTINDLFNSFENLLGVDLDFVVHTNKNFTIKATSIKSFNETDLLTFAVTVTSNMIKTAINGLFGLAGVFSVINVDQYWNHVYDVEFVGDLELSPQPVLSVDYTDLTGLNNNQKVEVQVIEEGRSRFTKWPFSITGDKAVIKVESEDADQIEKGIHWQLVFLPDGEPAGGDPVGRGQVRVQR